MESHGYDYGDDEEYGYDYGQDEDNERYLDQMLGRFVQFSVSGYLSDESRFLNLLERYAAENGFIEISEGSHLDLPG